jgi:hypothetical protein
LTYIVCQGNVTATIIWFAIKTGATAELSYYKEKTIGEFSAISLKKSRNYVEI